MKLKSSKPTCNFNHAIPAIVCRLFQLKSVCQTICQSTKTHNTPTYYSNAYIRTGMYSNFFLGEVVLWYSIYILLAQIRTTWVASTHLFTYNTHLKKIRNSAVSKFWWKSVELSKLKNLSILSILLDKIQWTLKSSHKDIRIIIFILRCERKAKQFEAHSIYKSLLGTKTFYTKRNQLCLSI